MMIPTLPERLLFLDLETTGVHAANDRIIEVGVCTLDPEDPRDGWSTLLNPDRPIPPFICQHTGINDVMVQDAPRFADLAGELLRVLAGRVLVAHNARFDYGFLQQEFERHGLAFAAPLLCTVKLSRRLFPGERRHGLDALMERYGLGCTARHRALADAQVVRDFVSNVVLACPPVQVERALAEQLGC